jgi:hypothetical protein
MRDTHDALEAAWAHHEQLSRRFEDETRLAHPEWFTLRQESNMKVKDMVQSKFLRKEDFEEDTILTIKGIKLEDLGNENANEQRYVLYFLEQLKGMVLNVTTIRVLEAAYGDDTDNWVKRKVTVYVDPNVSFQGRVVGGLRLRPIKDKPKPVAHEVEPDFDDKIPF